MAVDANLHPGGQRIEGALTAHRAALPHRQLLVAALDACGTCIGRGAQVRLVRDGTIIHDGRIGSLRRFQNDVSEVTEGQECGIVLENYPDVKEEDVLEVYETKQVERELE